MNEVLNSHIISDFKQGDQRAFKKVFDHLFPGLLIFTNRLTGCLEEAEDICLRTFQSLSLRCNEFETEINIKAFLYISARNACLNYLKAKQREKQHLQKFPQRMADDTFLEIEFAIKPPVVDAIYQAVEDLPGECRRIFKLLYFDELLPLEIAELLKISVSTVYNQKMRALRTLRSKFPKRTIVIALLLSLALLKPELYSFTLTGK